MENGYENLVNVSELVEQAKIAIDENVSSEALEGIQDIDTLSLEEIIAGKVEDAVRWVEAHASHQLLGGGRPMNNPISWFSQPGYGGGSIVLPDDFLRLVTFRMSDWSHSVTDAIDEDDPRYLMQSSRYGGVRGNPQRPVVAITHSNGGHTLEFWGCETGRDARIEVARYIALPKVDDGGRIAVCPLLVRSVVYRLAGLTATAVGATDKASLLLAMGNEMAGIITN